MIEIPLQAVPSQTLNVVLGAQYCKINVYQKSTGVFLDLFVNDQPIVTTRICFNLVRLVFYPYLGFFGDLVFVDTVGISDPDYTEIGTRFILAYIPPGEL